MSWFIITVEEQETTQVFSFWYFLSDVSALPDNTSDSQFFSEVRVHDEQHYQRQKSQHDFYVQLDLPCLFFQSQEFLPIKFED